VRKLSHFELAATDIDGAQKSKISLHAALQVCTLMRAYQGRLRVTISNAILTSAIRLHAGWVSNVGLFFSMN
jgi:hypothetical protein